MTNATMNRFHPQYILDELDAMRDMLLDADGKMDEVSAIQSLHSRLLSSIVERLIPAMLAFDGEGCTCQFNERNIERATAAVSSAMNHLDYTSKWLKAATDDLKYQIWKGATT